MTKKRRQNIVFIEQKEVWTVSVPKSETWHTLSEFLFFASSDVYSLRFFFFFFFLSAKAIVQSTVLYDCHRRKRANTRSYTTIWVGLLTIEPNRADQLMCRNFIEWSWRRVELLISQMNHFVRNHIHSLWLEVNDIYEKSQHTNHLIAWIKRQTKINAQSLIVLLFNMKHHISTTRDFSSNIFLKRKN